jgi:long-subunit acyl-CoA synthetase (AMP-forming)
MTDVLTALGHFAASAGSDPAMTDGAVTLTYGALRGRVMRLAHWLDVIGCKRLGLLLDNGLDWALLDLASRLAGVVLVPIPMFFSSEQIAHVIAQAALTHLATDQLARLRQDLRLLPVDAPVDLLIRPQTRLAQLGAVGETPLPGRTGKVTFTSGTTGAPKGICLSHAAIDRVASSLLEASRGVRDDRHLCLLPLATLLENISGIHVPLLAGAIACVPSLREVGLTGSSQFDVAAALGAITRFRATTIVTVPQMLAAMVSVLSREAVRHTHLRLVAVGGAPVAPAILRRAGEIGLPVFEGYGLSECSSVVAFNRPGDNTPGSVGKTLPHARVEIAPDGEVLVGGAVCEGVLGGGELGRGELGGAGEPVPALWPTGDLGRLDDHGRLYLTGRKKNVFITSFGRNVSPEWIECELAAEPGIAQAAVFGEGRPWNAAVIVPTTAAGVADRAAVPALVRQAVQQVNERLPDYARIRRWLIADASFTPANAQATPNGRHRRERIWDAYATRINHLYDSEASRVS